MEKEKIGIGVIGCRSISRTHLLHLSSREDVELVGVCDIIEGRAKRKAVEEAGVISTDILKVKQWLELIGCPALFRDMWSPSPWASPHRWVFDKKMEGGPIYEASHWIDFMNFLFGRPKTVYASFHHFKPGGLTAPDTFLLVIGYEAGDRVVWADAECLPGFDEFRIRHVGTRPALSTIGPKGSIHFPDPNGSKVLALYLNYFGTQCVETHPWETDWGATRKAYQAEVDYFLECVKTGQRPLINTAKETANGSSK